MLPRFVRVNEIVSDVSTVVQEMKERGHVYVLEQMDRSGLLAGVKVLNSEAQAAEGQVL